VLRADFARLPELLARPAPEQPEGAAEAVVPVPDTEDEPAPRAVPEAEPEAGDAPPDRQLELF
jgi:hypothetical protein